MTLLSAIEKIVKCSIEKDFKFLELKSVEEHVTGTLYTITLKNKKDNLFFTLSIKRKVDQENLIKAGSIDSAKWVSDSPHNIKSIFYKELAFKLFEALNNVKN